MNEYAISNFHSSLSDNELAHRGILGMRWGVRRYQPYGQGGYDPDNKGQNVGLAAMLAGKAKTSDLYGRGYDESSSFKNRFNKVAREFVNKTSTMKSKLKDINKIQSKYNQKQMDFYNRRAATSYDRYRTVQNHYDSMYDQIKSKAYDRQQQAFKQQHFENPFSREANEWRKSNDWTDFRTPTENALLDQLSKANSKYFGDYKLAERTLSRYYSDTKLGPKTKTEAVSRAVSNFIGNLSEGYKSPLGVAGYMKANKQIAQNLVNSYKQKAAIEIPQETTDYIKALFDW